MVFCYWLLSLSIIFSGFISAVACICISFFGVSVYLAVDGHLGCFYILVIMSNAVVNICVQVFVWISFLSGIYLGVELLGLCLNF